MFRKYLKSWCAVFASNMTRCTPSTAVEFGLFNNYWVNLLLTLNSIWWDWKHRFKLDHGQCCLFVIFLMFHRCGTVFTNYVSLGPLSAFDSVLNKDSFRVLVQMQGPTCKFVIPSKTNVEPVFLELLSGLQGQSASSSILHISIVSCVCTLVALSDHSKNCCMCTFWRNGKKEIMQPMVTV